MYRLNSPPGEEEPRCCLRFPRHLLLLSTLGPNGRGPGLAPAGAVAVQEAGLPLVSPPMLLVLVLLLLLLRHPRCLYLLYLLLLLLPAPLLHLRLPPEGFDVVVQVLPAAVTALSPGLWRQPPP